MSMFQTYENRVQNLFRKVVAVWLFLFAMTSVIMMVVIPGNSAHSMLQANDLRSIQKYNHIEPSVKVQAPDRSDLCLSRVHSKSAPTNQYNGVYASNLSLPVLSRGAGATSALGLVLGAHYALEKQRMNKDLNKKSVKKKLKQVEQEISHL